MDLNWHNPNAELGKKPIPNGRYQAQIVQIGEATTAGRVQYLRVFIEIPNYKGHAPDCISIFPPMNQEEVDSRSAELNALMDSFGIQRTNHYTETWKGKVGTVDVYQKWNERSGKSYATFKAVKPDDPKTEDWTKEMSDAAKAKRNGFQAPQQPQAPQQQAGFAPNTRPPQGYNPQQPVGANNYPEDIPF